MNQSETEASTNEPHFRSSFDWLGIGFGAGFMAALFFAVIPISGRVRFGDSECPWLDTFRVPDPGVAGWTIYIFSVLFFCVCYGFILGLSCWALERLLPRSWFKAITLLLLLGIS